LLVKELVIGDGYHFFHSGKGDSHELYVLDTRFLNPDFKNPKAGAILDGLSLDDLKQLHQWLGEVIGARRFSLPGT
jgi:hypothetical protein